MANCFDKSQICDDIYVRIMTTRVQRGGFWVIAMFLLLQCAGLASILSPYKFIESNNLCILLYLQCISLKFDGCALNFLLRDFNQFLPLLLFWCSPFPPIQFSKWWAHCCGDPLHMFAVKFITLQRIQKSTVSANGRLSKPHSGKVYVKSYILNFADCIL